uniref:Uncharacterized protein n=1 Tax=Setaria digitata TaxID=48799 RepID=A0A915Q7I7_9BILA
MEAGKKVAKKGTGRKNSQTGTEPSTVKNSAFQVSSASNDTISCESSGQPETSAAAFFGASFGLAQLPGSVKPENLMPTLSERPVTLTAMSADATAAVAYDPRIISATPYYNGGYSGANYTGIYGTGSSQNYYPVVSTSLRGTAAAAAAAATSFPFAAAAASHAYYVEPKFSNSKHKAIKLWLKIKFENAELKRKEKAKLEIDCNGYTPTHFDYTSYPATMHCYGSRGAYQQLSGDNTDYAITKGRLVKY